jgi:hypothetical protein
MLEPVTAFQRFDYAGETIDPETAVLALGEGLLKNPPSLKPLPFRGVVGVGNVAPNVR